MKINKYYNVAPVIFALLLIYANVNANNKVNVPALGREDPSRSFTCWAVSTRMVLAAYNTHVSEESIIRYAFSGALRDEPVALSGGLNTVDRVIHGFNVNIVPFAIAQRLNLNNPLDRNSLVQSINERKPIIAYWNIKNQTVGHMVVIVGYEDLQGNREATILFNEPITEKEQKMPYTQFVDNANFSWTSSLCMTQSVPAQRKPMWFEHIPDANTGDVVIVPTGRHNTNTNLIIPTTSENVTLSFEPGAELRFTENAREIWVGATGQITGSDNVTLSHDIRVYSTPHPRDPVFGESDNDRVIGLFSSLCDALYRGGEGRTIKTGPGIYDFGFVVGDQGLIGTRDPSTPIDPARNSILRVGFGSSESPCSYIAPQTRPGNTTLTKDMRIEFNNDVYGESSSALTVYGDGIDIFENCIFEGVNTSTANKNVTALQLGSQDYPLTGKVIFRNCTFRNLGTAVFIDHPTHPDQSPVFENCIFEDNNTDLRFNENSQAFCGLEANQIKSIAVGVGANEQRYTNESAINNLINSSGCSSSGLMPVRNFSVADPGFVDPLVSDFRLTSISPLRAAGTGLKDIGYNSMDAIFTFSSFLNGRVDFGNGQMVQFENGALTTNTVGDAVTFRFHYAKNLRPVYELKFRGGFINKPSTVTVWKNSKVSAPSLPNEYVVWDASVNGVRFVKMTYAQLLSSGSVTKTVVPKTTAPAPVSGVNIVDDNNNAVIRWNRNTDPGISRYKLFRAPAATPHLASQIASLPADVTEYKDVNRRKADNIYSIVAYDSTGNMSAHINSGNKMYNFSGFDTSVRDTLRITPSGVTVQINNPNYLHGAMITVRNKGHNDSLIVDWYGVRDQNHQDCGSRTVNLFGNGAQINNIALPKLGNGAVLFNLRSATNETYLVDVEIFNWRNGYGCR
ncbi:MAG: hypothetical protein LBI42_00760 [Chitinispirillales bacterium]|jgi:hypothetical protein|nr:hypothetical protein [Chitinispirillales bacterium]